MARSIVHFLLCLGIIGYTTQTAALAPINIFRPWDINFRPHVWCDTRLQITTWAEGERSVQGVNGNNMEVEPLNIWQQNQNALAMLQGFPADSPMAQKLQLLENIGGPTLDDGVRGHLIFNGKFKYNGGFGLTARYQLPYNFSLAAYVPFYSMQLNDVTFTDLTGVVTMADIAVRENLTNHFVDILKTFNTDLNLSGWKERGLGDAILMAEWYRHFPQLKPILKDVALDARLGVMIPTGVEPKVSSLLPISFGNDGSTALIFGGGLDVTWWNLLKGGFDVELIHAFGNTRLRRIKVADNQTELLLLAVAPAHLDIGIVRRYNLYAEFSNVIGGLSGRAAYQYWHQGDSKLTLGTNLYSNQIANTAESLQEWTIHEAIFILSYDFTCHMDDCAFVTPELSLFYKFPFNGQRAILAHTYGATFTLSF